MTIKRKSGPLSPGEVATIKAHVSSLSFEQIGDSINRSARAVEKWCRENLPKDAYAHAAGGGPVADRDQIKKNLQRSLKWSYLREELTDREQAFFEEQYACYVQQFKEDILPSEEDQIFSMLKLDIAMGRNRRDVRRMREEIERLEDEYRGVGRGPDRSDEDRVRTREIEEAMGMLRAAETSRTSEYLKITQQYNEIQKDLNATRSQRVNKVDSMKESWLDVVKKVTDPAYRASLGTAAEFARLATEKEEKRLSQWHAYENGVVDQPILTAETALDDEPGGEG